MTGRPSADASPGAAPGEKAPGLGEQFRRTRGAFFGLIGAHVDLAKAEFSEIGDQVKRAAAMGCVAAILLFFTGGLIFIGLPLFLGEVLLGSIGWGVLDGTLLLVGVAVLLILAAIDLPAGRAFGSLLLALVCGVVVTAVLFANWASLAGGQSPLDWFEAMGAGMLAFAVLGLLLGAPFGRWAAVGGAFAGLVFGLLLGILAVLAHPDLRGAAAVGLAALLLFWPICAAVLVFRHGLDMKKLRARFVPDQTIATTKETIEWVREQMPLGRKS